MSAGWKMSGAVDLYINARPEEVYDRIADVTGTGGRSLECSSCAWLPGASPGSVGSRFRGRNRKGRLIRWSRVCEVTEADRGHVFAFRTVPERWDLSRRDSTTWTYTLRPDGQGTTVTHSYEITKPPVEPFPRIFGWLFPHHKDMRPHMAHTLEALRDQLKPGTDTPMPERPA
jgi:hypothetical protein